MSFYFKGNQKYLVGKLFQFSLGLLIQIYIIIALCFHYTSYASRSNNSIIRRNSSNFSNTSLLVSSSISNRRYQPIIFIDKSDLHKLNGDGKKRIVKITNKNQPQQQKKENNLLVITAPTYRKLKFKRQQLVNVHNNHHTPIQSSSTLESLSNDKHRNFNRTTTVATTKISALSKNVVPRILFPDNTSSLYFYGPSILQIGKIKILPHKSANPDIVQHRRVTKRKKLIKSSYVNDENSKRIVNDHSNKTTIVLINNNLENNEIRDPRPKVIAELFTADPLVENDFDILRNNILKANTLPRHLRRSLPSFQASNISMIFQSPPNFRVQSTSFGKPAPKPSYHWSYNTNAPPIVNLTNRFTAKPQLNTFRPVIITTAYLSPNHFPGITRTNSGVPPLQGLNGQILGFKPSLLKSVTMARPEIISRPVVTQPSIVSKITTSTTPAPTTVAFSLLNNYDIPFNSVTVAPTKPRRRNNKSRNKQRGLIQSSSPRSADRCTEEKCLLPYCRCGSSMIPGGLKFKELPQLVMITFDDSINELNWDLYQEIFSGRYNPNGCPILGTFYVSHEWTDYSQVQNLYASGHEMASHTITHSFGDKFSKEKWLNEVNGQREILSLYGGVKYEDVRGMRAPFLQPGGNKQFEMLYEANFTYDSSLPVFDNNPPFWPYTFDYSMSHECMITPCPTKSFPGLWEVGMVMLIDHRGGRCSMVDACSHPATEEEVFENLLKNFNRHYHSNKAPFGLYFHSAWFNIQHFKRGFLHFIDHIAKSKDVYFVTKWQLIQWMQHPTPVSRLKSFQPFHCDYSDRQPCHHPKVCSTSFRDGPRYLKTCQKCPKYYPWVGKTGFNHK